MSTASASVDQAKREFEVSEEFVARRLQEFTRYWSPRDPHLANRFQIELTEMMLMCMRHQSRSLRIGIATYAETMFDLVATKPITVIMKGDLSRDKDQDRKP